MTAFNPKLLSGVALAVVLAGGFGAYALSAGGPKPDDSTTTLTYFVYGSESIIRNNIGLQACAAVLLFLVLLGLSGVQLFGLGKRVHYAG